MADQDPTIPSSQSGLPATAVIPGSEVQKDTAVQQGTLPAPPSLTGGLNGLALLLGAIGAVGQGAVAGLKGQGAKAAAESQALVDQLTTRKALSYVTQLNAGVQLNPALAGAAIQNLQGLVATGGSALSPEALGVINESIKSFQTIGARQVAQGIMMKMATMPAAATRIEVFQTALKGFAQVPGIDPMAAVKAATEMGALVPDTAARYETTIDQDRGVAYIRDKMTGNVSARRIEVEGAPGAELGPKITAFRPEVESEIELQGLDKGRLLSQLNSLDPTVRGAANKTVQELAVAGRTRTAQEKLTLDKDDVLLLPKIGVTRDVTNMGQLTAQEKTRLIEARKQFTADAASDAAIKRGLELGTEFAFTRTGEPIPAGTPLEVIRANGGILRPASIAKDIMEVNKVLPQLDIMESLAKRAYAAYKLGGQTGIVPSLERMIQLPIVRASMSQLDFNKLQAMSKLVNMEVVRGIIHNRVTNVELAGGDWLQPHDKDTIDLVLAKLEFLRFQGAVTKGGMLGQPAPNIEDAEIIARFPNLLGKAVEGQGGSPQKLGGRPIRWR